MNLQPPCTSYPWITLLMYLTSYSYIYPPGLSTISERGDWHISLALGLSSLYFSLDYLLLNFTSSILRDNGFLRPSYLVFLFIFALFVFWLYFPFLTSFHNSHVLPVLFKVGLKSTSPIWSFLQIFLANFMVSYFNLYIFSIFSLVSKVRRASPDLNTSCIFSNII